MPAPTPTTNWYHEFDVVFDSEVITVIAKLGDVEQTFTMQRYADTRFGDENGYAYGACVPNPFDFSEYPIGFNGPVDGTKTRMYVISQISSLEIEVLGGTQDTPAVWEKVGGGSQSDGYEINNPTLTMNVDNTTGSFKKHFNIYFVNDDGYLSLLEKGVSAGSWSEEKTLVIGWLEDDDIDYGYIIGDRPDQVSGETNCRFVSDENVIIITDPTEDASIALTYGSLN